MATRLFSILLLGIAIAAAYTESTSYWAKRYAWASQHFAEKAKPNEILLIANHALSLDPNDTQALYMRAKKLKDTNQSEELKNALPRLLLVHPNQASVRRIAGEHSFREGAAAQASDLLWQAMWINPLPPSTPVNFWRMTMMASELAGRKDQAVAAGLRALWLSERDDSLGPLDRQGLMLDVSNVFDRMGWKLTAAHVKSLNEGSK